MGISAVGSLDSAAANGLTTLSLTAVAAVGDLRVLHLLNTGAVTVVSVTGGNVTTWTKVHSNTAPANATVYNDEIWIGSVTSSGSTSVSFTWSGTQMIVLAECLTFHSSSPCTWLVEPGQHVSTGQFSSTTITFAALTASQSGELYCGFSQLNTKSTYGNPAGGTTQVSADNDPIIYLLNVTAGGVTPTVTATTPTTGQVAGILIIAQVTATGGRNLLLMGVGT